MLIDALVLGGIIIVGFGVWLALDYWFPSHREQDRLWKRHE